jgi:hypothetical protein
MTHFSELPLTCDKANADVAEVQEIAYPEMLIWK